MKLTLSSAVLSNRLTTLSKVLNSKNTMQILDCFLFEVNNDELTITASDKENEMKATVHLDEADTNGRFAINSHTILDAVKELPDQPITMEIDTTTYAVNIAYQNGDYHFTATNADEFPLALPLDGVITTISIPAAILGDNIGRSLFATASEELRPVMNGVYFDLTPEALAIVASDGHKLVRNKVLTISSEESHAFILPKKPANLLKNVLPHDDTEVLIHFDDRNAEIEFAGGKLKCRLIEGKYPNYNSVIPANNPCQLNIDRKALFGSLRRVLPFASESSQLVRLRMTSGNLEVSAEDIDFATSAKENIVCDYAGNNMSIGFKGSTLAEILNNLTSEEVVLELADPSRPCLILPNEQPEGEDVLMLIMPMLLND